MRKILSLILILGAFSANAQIKISALPTVSGTNMDSVWTVTVQEGITKKARGYLFKGPGFDSTSLSNRINAKIDSVKITSDSLYYYVGATKYFGGLIVGGGGGGSDDLNDVTGRDSVTTHSIGVVSNNSNYMGLSSLGHFGSALLTNNPFTGGTLEINRQNGAGFVLDPSFITSGTRTLYPFNSGTIATVATDSNNAAMNMIWQGPDLKFYKAAVPSGSSMRFGVPSEDISDSASRSFTSSGIFDESYVDGSASLTINKGSNIFRINSANAGTTGNYNDITFWQDPRVTISSGIGGFATTYFHVNGLTETIDINAPQGITLQNTGSAGQVITSQGTGLPAIWANPSGGSSSDSTKIPITGTEPGKPVTGDIEVANFKYIKSTSPDSATTGSLYFDEGTVNLFQKDNINGYTPGIGISTNGVIVTDGTSPNFKGITSPIIYLNKSNNNYAQMQDISDVRDSLSARIDSLTDREKGIIYNATSFSSLSDFTATGFTPTIVDDAIRLTGGTSDFNKYITLNNSINTDENVEVEITFTIRTTPDANSFGIALGKKSINSWFQNSFAGQFSMATSNSGIYLNQGNFTTIKTTSDATFNTFSIGDSCKIRFKQFENVISIYCENITTGYAISSMYKDSLKSVSTYTPYLPTTSEWVIWNIGNQTIDINTLKITSFLPQNADLVLVGDSKLTGYSALSTKNRVGNLLNAVTYAAGGDRTVEIVQSIDYLASTSPKKVILNIGRNDLASGVSTGTWQANYSSIVSTLESAGTTVIHLLPIPDGGVDQTALYNYIVTTYGIQNCINPISDWNSGIMLSSDSVHPNVLGFEFLTDLIRTSGKINK